MLIFWLLFFSYYERKLDVFSTASAISSSYWRNNPLQGVRSQSITFEISRKMIIDCGYRVSTLLPRIPSIFPRLEERVCAFFFTPPHFFFYREKARRATSSIVVSCTSGFRKCFQQILFSWLLFMSKLSICMQ